MARRGAPAPARRRRRRHGARRPHHLAARPHRHARRGPHRRPRRAATATSPIQGVKFFVDDALVGEDTDGPRLRGRVGRREPVRADRDLASRSTDAKGRTRDQPRASSRRSTSSSRPRSRACSLEATVHDKTGRPIAGLGNAGFVLIEDGVRAGARPGAARGAAGDLRAARRQQPEHRPRRRLPARRGDALHALPAARRIACWSSPFSETLGADTGPDRRPSRRCSTR